MVRPHEDPPIRDFVPYQAPEPELEEEAQDNQVDGVLVLPPLQDHEPMYPPEYIAYCRRRMSQHRTEWKWEKDE